MKNAGGGQNTGCMALKPQEMDSERNFMLDKLYLSIF